MRHALIPSLILSGVCLLAVASPCAAQQMQAVTSPAGPGMHVVISWPPAAGASGYNLYRKSSSGAAYPATPMNAQVLRRFTVCGQIQAVIPPGSTEWDMIQQGLSSPAGVLFDPCTISSIPSGSTLENKFQFLVRGKWKIAVVAGQAFDDATVTAGTTYFYELRSADSAGHETAILFSDVQVTAGTPIVLPAPDGLTAQADDSKVMLLWGNVGPAAGFNLYRATAVVGPYQLINDSSFISRLQFDFSGKPLRPDNSTSNGFVDFKRWNASGNATTHVVNGVNIDGPNDGTTYYYKVVSVDLLGQPGPLSVTPVSALPMDTTPPMAPSGVSATSDEVDSRLEIRWNVIQLDIDGHFDSSGITGYRVYRYDAESAPLSSGLLIGGIIAQPGPGTLTVTAADSDPILRPPFGEKTFWYRVEAIDAAGNISSRSAAAGGNLKDITPPGIPRDVSAEGFDDFIRVTWQLNIEPDMDGYLIYRSLCNRGRVQPCKGKREPSNDTGDLSQTECTGDFSLVGVVSQADARVAGPQFEDHTVPKGSPLCYSYWVKAQDRAQNKSGSWPFPSAAELSGIVCQRLRDKTPPEPAIISGLSARNLSILVEWVGPPVQDIAAYHVYRSDKDSGPYSWVGGETVPLPPALPQVLTHPYSPPAIVGCATIPLVIHDYMTIGLFLDTTANPKSIYWYKVVGIDQSGNEAPLAKAAPISTFTFTANQPVAPVIISVTPTTSVPFALVVRWTPAFDPTADQGFAVFRSLTSNGPYRQVGTIVLDSEYQDQEVVRGVQYWYKVLLLKRSTQVTPPSAPVSGQLP